MNKELLRYEIHNRKIVSVAYDVPIPNSDELLVIVDYCGICGTDYQKFLSFSEETEWGHEILGRIADCNGNYSIPVIIRTTYPCYTCEQCRNGLRHKCISWSRAQINGFSRYIVVNKKCIIPLNDSETDPIFTLVEPLNVAIQLVSRLNPHKEESFAIIGNSTIALLSAFYLHSIGCKKINIFARSHSPARTEFCRLCNAVEYSFNDISQELYKAEKIINTAPYNTMPMIIQYASNYSWITFNGISKQKIIPIDMLELHFKNIVLCPVFPHPQDDFSGAISLIRQNKEVISNIITNIYSFDNFSNAFEMMANKEKNHIKVLICMK